MEEWVDGTVTGQQAKKADRQLLKIREMREILEFDRTTEPTGEESLKPVKSAPGFEGKGYHAPDLRKEIEPWLTALFQSEHLSLLTGSGLTSAVHQSITGQAPTGFANRTYAAFDQQVQAEAKRSAQKMGRGEPNPEDQLRSALRIAEGLRILVRGNANSDPWKSLTKELETFEKDIEAAIEGLITGTLNAERRVASQNEKREKALLMLVSFLIQWEFPRLCRGGSRSLTVPGVHPETPIVSREAHEKEKPDGRV